MHTLTHFRLCPFSRAVRLALAERGIDVELVEERPWEWRPEFLALNPAGELPVLQLEGGPALCGVYAISEYLAEEKPPEPEEADAVAFSAVPRRPRPARRDPPPDRLVQRQVQPRSDARAAAGKGLRAPAARRRGPPDVDFLRAIRTNLRYHMSYISYLADRRRWLAGDELSFADLAAAAHLSSVDYLGEVPWEEFAVAKIWYARLKSRRAFRTILADRVPGALPAAHYADLDF